MKPTYKNLAEFYGLTRQTISTWETEKPKVYEAMRKYFIDQNSNTSQIKPTNQAKNLH